MWVFSSIILKCMYENDYLQPTIAVDEIFIWFCGRKKLCQLVVFLWLSSRAMA